MKTLLLTLTVFLSVTCYSQARTAPVIQGIEIAKKELNIAVGNKGLGRGDTLIIKNKESAIYEAESELFNKYTPEKIIWQRPYEVYLIDNYWVLMGTLPKGYKGGTFLIIIDGTNNKVVRLGHSK